MNLPSSYLHQYWQNQILDQLGVVRWVDFHAEVIELDITELEKSLNFQPVIINQIDADKSDDVNFAIITPQDTEYDEPFYLDKSTNSLENFSEIDGSEQVQNANIGVAIDKFHLQMVVFENWIIVADVAVLQENHTQLSLWQNLLNQLHLTPQDFVFPMVMQNATYDLNHKNQKMCTDILALASFEGKICALTQDKSRQVGTLTTLPDVLKEKQIHAFPSLEIMLNNFQQKRIFWHQLKGVFN